MSEYNHWIVDLLLVVLLNNYSTFIYISHVTCSTRLAPCEQAQQLSIPEVADQDVFSPAGIELVIKYKPNIFRTA